MVYSGLYPVNNNDFEALREALAKLRLNDASFTYQPETSEGLGFGFRCGFLGMLHREIIQQRLERDSELPPDVSPQGYVDNRVTLLLGYSTGPLYSPNRR